MISLILARADNGVIGDKGALPWRLPDDMRRFKALTMGKPCIMGRKTWESLPKKPLPGRGNIVVTRNAAFAAEGAAAAPSFDAALVIARRENPSEIMVIGGAEIYAAALPQARRIHLTEIHAAFEGDAHMPAFDRKIWRETTREDRQTPDGLAYSYVTLERAAAPPI
ncbi:MAG: dihydrofolate reductase [Alphaproteobacteria bacterium]|nr:dihydrofolate reductase [Alphaproteobacteria bacterium]MDE2266108.1 dihydrofolate reductase [Alphaproteobacteria bacterium]